MPYNMSLMTEQTPFDPQHIPEYADAADTIRDLNSAVDDQNGRLPLADEIGDADFRRLAFTGIAEEQAATVTELSKQAAAIPYQELGEHALELTHEEEQLAEAVQDPQVRVDEIGRWAELAAGVAPRIATEARKMAEHKIGTIMANSQVQFLRLEQVRQQRDDLYARFGADWPVRQALARQHELGLIAAEAAVPAVETSAPVVDETTPAPEAEAPDEIVMAEPVAEVIPEPEEPLIEPEVTPAESPETSETPESTELEEAARSGSEAARRKADIVSSVMWSVAEFAISHGAFRMEVMRRELPELAQLSDDEYYYFRTHFKQVRDRIQNALAEKGVEVTWVQGTKQKRGATYELLEVVHAAHPQELPTEPMQEPTDLYVRGQEPEHQTVRGAIHTVSPQLSLEQEAEDLVQIPLVREALAIIDNVAARGNPSFMRRTYLSREVSGLLGGDVAAAGKLISGLIEKGILHKSGHHKGTQLLSREKPAEDDNNGRSDDSYEARPLTEADIEKLARRDVQIAKVIFAKLNENKYPGYKVETGKLLAAFAGKDAATAEEIKATLGRLKDLELIAVETNERKGRKTARFANGAVKRAWNRVEQQFVDRLTEKLRSLHGGVSAEELRES
jgi:hypothetical protein